MCSFRVVLLSVGVLRWAVVGLDNGAAPTPPMGMSTWDAFGFNISSQKLMDWADQIVAFGLRDAGYVYLLLDDGWTTCNNYSDPGDPLSSGCTIPGDRDASGRITPDPVKFPHGHTEWTSHAHKLGLKTGIYSAPHGQTCGGFTGSLGHEGVDAQSFADWGIDFVKMDAGCRTDCSIHDGCLVASLTRMRDGLNATGRPIVYYIDDGNPTSGPAVYNPFLRGVPVDPFTASHVARTWPEMVTSWGPSLCNMWKLWYDRWDGWASLLDNAHQQVGMQWFQSRGAFNNMDMLTVGKGGMLQGQYRAELFLYAVLATPLILSAPDITVFANGTWEHALVTNPEVLAINQDPDCVQGTKLSGLTDPDGRTNLHNWAGDVWIKPLSDGSFAAALINRDPHHNHSLRVGFGPGNTWCCSPRAPSTGCLCGTCTPGKTWACLRRRTWR